MNNIYNIFIDHEAYINLFCALSMFAALFFSSNNLRPNLLDMILAGLTFLGYSFFVLNTFVNILHKGF